MELRAESERCWKSRWRIFGRLFVENNKNKCYLLIGNEKKNLSEYLELNEEQKDYNALNMKLIETNKITNMSCIFEGCESLISLPDISKWDTKNVTDISNLFHDCK